MKILAGKYRGKNIESRQDRSLRPTKSSVRESVFNILMHGKFLYEDDFIEDDNPSRIEDRIVVDIFCGTGALGFEALSRGAKHVTFVDQSQETIALAKQNARSIGVEDDVSFTRSDSTRLPRAKHACDLAFIDPPYNMNLAKKAMESLRDNGWLKHGAVVVVEEGKLDDVHEVDSFVLLSDRAYDKTRISIYQYREA